MMMIISAFYYQIICQIRSPLSALRTFGKVLTRRLAREPGMNGELARNIMVQSDQLADLLVPLTTAGKNTSHVL